MNLISYTVILTNGTMQHKYYVKAGNRDQAVILAQAEAIQQARGYQLVSVEKHHMGVYKND